MISETNSLYPEGPMHKEQPGTTHPSIAPQGGRPETNKPLISQSENLKTFGFHKQEKLKSRKQIAALFEQGHSVSHYPLKLVYLPTTTKTVTQAGVTVPKRRFKLAVTRNRIKRLMREAYRHRKSLFFNNNTTAYAFLFLYIGKEIPTQQTLHKVLEKVAEKFQKKISDEPK